ncbi:sensor domain-containing diguanylate cyclase [Thermomonas sp. HDW16]|uniref:sensor domain-containing diguanylate cyclase n=1 Tax=Thermomonas sp. HDW16 TaxID=2714945 RepID=UPI00140A7072|nr:sensor domain-containing diguanylate cyclase [Thermomonas sp. HDW16]QIL19923.1 diguanylate cyclase [Thermomonas sp. HDW16]
MAARPGRSALEAGFNAQLSANAIDDFLQGQLSGVELLADGAMRGGQPLDVELGKLLRAYPAMLRTLATDRQGRIIAARAANGRPVPLAVELVADREWFRAPRDSGLPHVSDAYRARIYGNEALVAVSAPMLRDGSFDGVLQASIPIQRYIRTRSDNLRRRGFELLLLDRQNNVVHASEGLRWRFLDGAGSLGAEIRHGAVQPGDTGAMRSMVGLLRDGDKVYLSAVAMRTGWVVAVVAPQQRLLALAMPRLGLLLGLLAVTTLGVLIALWRMRKLLAASMGRLLASLHGYALGGTLDPAQLTRMPEELQPLAGGIGDLAARMNAAFDELRQVLEQREQVIAERTESLRQAVNDLDRLSRTDALTGSLNYRGFLEAADTMWRQARASGKPLSVLALDIDFFKRYNDLYGHAEGDGALRRFAGAVRSALLHADDVLARPGGEEFIVFLPGSTLEQATQVGQRVCERVRSADIVHAASPEGRMTVSVGIASMQPDDDDDDDDSESMLRRADAALYRAKAAGRNRVSG